MAKKGKIHTLKDMLYWKMSLEDWHHRHVKYLNEKTKKADSHRERYTYKMVRKAYVHVMRALPTMFTFIEHPEVPKTTKALKSFFGHLKENISPHRGLSKSTARTTSSLVLKHLK